ncbi:hypothetical protein COCNU_10G008420 [Cocos nucifera]|uniref:Uncharacterized protein n=1 Tax=Cocos nucifera TaxID=13894 RepID=A0A8K0IMJ6_COCNU|nr:hypothetical protein COCNU_10G008420 [Cocos nucifera]
MDDDLDKIRVTKFYKQQKEAITVIIRTFHYMATFINTIQDFHDECKKVEKELILARKKATKAKNEAVEANNEVVKIKEEMEKRIMKVGHLAIEAFKNFEELNEKMGLWMVMISNLLVRPALRVLMLKLLHLLHLLELKDLHYEWMQL